MACNYHESPRDGKSGDTIAPAPTAGTVHENVLFGAARWCHFITSAITIPGLSIFDSLVKLTRE